MYKNISNLVSKNLFETSTGVLNIAPVKISGQYKIVVNLDGNLYLDDYTGRRILIDKTRNFLPQVSNFLKVNTLLTDNSILKYGGFQKSTKKYWHVPLYLGTSSNHILPKYFVLSRVVNETISDISQIYNFGKLHQVIDLEKIGLFEIFNQILKEKYFSYPVYFNWEDNIIKIYGYSINSDSPAVYSLDINDLQANTNDLQVFSNTILNTFVKQNIFFPLFINIEFEFSYSNEDVIFNNFYGYLSNGKEITVPAITNDFFNIKIQDYSNNILVWEQENKIPGNTILLNKYIDIVGSGSVRPITEQLPQYTLKTSRLSVNDNFSIFHPDGQLDFEYIVENSDMKSTLYESLVTICNKATIKSKRNYLFSVEKISDQFCKIKIIINLIDDFIDEYVISFPSYFIVSDRFNNLSNYYNFRGITKNDIWIPGQPELLNDVNNILIDNVIYTITDKFKYDDKTIIRLNKEINIIELSECKVYHDEFEKLIQLEPIQFLNYNSDLYCYNVYEQSKYVQNLITEFNQNSAIEKFSQVEVAQNLQYIKEFDGEIVESNLVLMNDNNTDICLSMLFNSVGSTSFITPNILNIDKQLYIQNGNLDTDQLDSDTLRYNWFLIKGKCPDYLKNDIRFLRYFDDIPKITSRLIKISDDYCETIFLGVKYQLPTKYENYQFATYLSFNDQKDFEINYNFVVDRTEKTIYLVINKYLDFVDLLRGGDVTKEPLLDLGFFYSVENSFNENSEYIGDFKNSSLKLCEEFKSTDKSIFFLGNEVRDWKYFNPIDNKWYIAIRNQVSINPEKISDLRLLFSPSTTDNIFHVYATIEISGVKYSYPSIIVNVKNIASVEKEYLWCEDVSVKFFDTEQFFVKEYNNLTNLETIFLVDKTNIITSVPVSNNIFGNYEQTTTIVVDATNKQFKLILPSIPISLKENYFEINQIVAKDSNDIFVDSKSVFTFPEFILGLSDNDIIDLFDSSTFDTSVILSKVSLFNRNQIWRIIQDLFRVDLKFKFLSKVMIRLIINKFMVTNLIDYIEVNSLPIVYNDLLQQQIDYIKFNVFNIDKNIVIWKLLDEDKIVLINRFRTAYLPYLPTFNNEIDFQLPKYKVNNRLFNIYDNCFGGDNISATGLWQEVQGNVISSFFCNENDIVITIPFSQTVDYKSLLIQSLTDINKIIITNNNETYINKINPNINEYIFDSYVKYILTTFFNFDSVLNEFNKKISYEIVQQNPFIINLKETSQSLTFVFKRK